MKKLFLLIVSLLLLTSCNNLTQSTSSKTKTIESNTSTVSSSKETNKSSVTTTKKSDNTSIKTDSLKQKGNLAFYNNNSGEGVVGNNVMEIIEGEDLLIGLYVNDNLVEDGVKWYHTDSDCVDAYLYGSYLFVLGLKGGEIEVVAETEEYEASCIIKIKSQVDILVNHFKAKAFEHDDVTDPYYYFQEYLYIENISCYYCFSYHVKTKTFKVNCIKTSDSGNLKNTTEATIAWTWGSYDQAEFKCSETLKYKAEEIEASTTVVFDNSCITFYASTQNINVAETYRYRVIERGWENITLNDCEEMWNTIKAAHKYVLDFFNNNGLQLKLFLKNYNY